jgi:enoyl-CoA hydratase/carnithine racemase
MGEMNYETLTVSRSDAALVATLNRPAQRNAINLRMMEELIAVTQESERDASIRVLIVTGGTEFFSAGADLKEISESRASAAQNLTNWRRVTNALEELAKPVIAAIEGFCLTGGLEFALACDIRVAGESAYFGITSAKLGTIPGFGATQRLPRVVGASRALEILFSAEQIDAAEAYRIGLINRMTSRGGALGEARRLAAIYAERAPLSLGGFKRAVYRGLGMDLATGLDLEQALGAALVGSSDRKEGIAAFMEKRKPQFKGQ